MQGPRPTPATSKPQFSSRGLPYASEAVYFGSQASLWVESAQEVIKSSHPDKMATLSLAFRIVCDPENPRDLTTVPHRKNPLHSRTSDSSISNNPSKALVIGTNSATGSRPASRSFSSHPRFVGAGASSLCIKSPRRRQQIPVTNSLADNRCKVPNRSHNSLGSISADDRFGLQPLGCFGIIYTTAIAWSPDTNPQARHDHRMAGSIQRQSHLTTARGTLQALPAFPDEHR